jgi:hypothetical protein
MYELRSEFLFDTDWCDGQLCVSDVSYRFYITRG